jgi:hypothetical protein
VGSGRVRKFEIIFRPDSDEAPIQLESVADANQATMAFHAQVQRLLREGTALGPGFTAVFLDPLSTRSNKRWRSPAGS